MDYNLIPNLVTNYRFRLTPGFCLMEMLVAAAVIFWALKCWRNRPDGAVAGLLRHRDRIWFALLLLFVLPIAVSFFAFHVFFNHMARGPGLSPRIAVGVFAVAAGVVYGMTGSWFASPAKKTERLSFGAAFLVAAALIILNSGLSLAVSLFHIARSFDLPATLAALVIVAFLVSRMFVLGKPRIQEENVPADVPVKVEYNPAYALAWLMVGLVPIPILLVFASSNPPNRSWGTAVFIICASCNLCGGLGCLGRLKIVGVRIILGLFLGLFFFLLSWLLAAFAACSHSGGI